MGYDVAINGRPYVLEPFERKEISISEGDLKIAVTGTDLPVEE